MWRCTCPHVVFYQRPRQPQLAFTERSNSCMKDWNPKTSFLFPDFKTIYFQIWRNLFPYFIWKEPISIFLAYFPNPFLFSYTWSGLGWVPSHPLAAGKASEWSGNLTPPPISPLLQTILSLQFPADSFKSFFLSPTFWILSALFLCKLFVSLL